MKKISDLILYKFPFFQIFKKIGIFDENFNLKYRRLPQGVRLAR